MNLQEIIEKAPILVNKYVWEELTKYATEAGESDEKVELTAIKLEYKALTEVEKALLSDEATACCYKLKDEDGVEGFKYEFLGYYCFVGDGEFPEEWKDRLEKEGVVLEVPTKVFDEDFFSIKTNRIKRMDICYQFSLEWVESQKKAVGIPYCAKPIDVVKEMFGVEGMVESAKVFVEACESKIYMPQNLTSIYQHPSLQEVVLSVCENHDRTTYTYNYKIGDLQFKAYVAYDGEDNVQVTFVSDELTIDTDYYYYLFFNNFFYQASKHIKVVDNSEYLLQKTREDIIS